MNSLLLPKTYTINDDQFEILSKVVLNSCGIILEPSKRNYIEFRISKRIRELQLEDLNTYLHHLSHDHDNIELCKLIDEIVINHSLFFRHQLHFNWMQSCLLEWVSQGKRRLRIWSAACSSGEEPYSIAIQIHSNNWQRTMDIKILASDISYMALMNAVNGHYNKKKLINVSTGIKNKYFKQDENRFEYSIHQSLKDLILFKRLNLAKQPFPMKGPLDVIFCCNVLFYFDPEVRIQLLSVMHSLLNPGGYLFVGPSENLPELKKKFKYIKSMIYQKQ